MKKIRINIGLNTTTEAVQLLEEYFPIDSFEYKKKIDDSSFLNEEVIVTFLLGAITSGFTWDLMKVGLIKLYKKIFEEKENKEGSIIITIEKDDKIVRIENGVIVIFTIENKEYIESLTDLFEIIENDAQNKR